MMMPRSSCTSPARMLLEELNRKYNERYDQYEPRQLVIPMAFWTRAFEKVSKQGKIAKLRKMLEKY